MSIQILARVASPFCISQNPSPARQEKSLYMYQCSTPSSATAEVKIIQGNSFLSTSERKMEEQNMKLLEDGENVGMDSVAAV